MSLNRIRRLAGINERNLTSELQQTIDAQLQHFPAYTHGPMLDALELLRKAGPTGLRWQDWANSLSAMLDDDGIVRDILASAVKDFGFVVHQIAPRRYAWQPNGLMETFTADPGINREIERRLDRLPSEMRTPVLDALEMLMQHGKNGIAVNDWARRVREIHGDMPMAEVLKTVVREFPNLVQRTAPKTYAWREAHGDDSEIDDPTLQAAIGGQVALTQAALRVIREMGSFTKAELLDQLGGRTNPQIAAFVEHLLASFGSMLSKQGDRYTLKSETPITRSDTMQHFRDLVANPKPEEN